MEAIEAFFGGIGNVTVSNTRDMATYRVGAIQDIINIIIPLPLRAWSIPFDNPKKDYLKP